MLDGFDRVRGEVVLAGGELDPDVDGGDLALAVPEVRPLRAGGVVQSFGQGSPRVLVDMPVL